MRNVFVNTQEMYVYLFLHLDEYLILGPLSAVRVVAVAVAQLSLKVIQVILLPGVPARAQLLHDAFKRRLEFAWPAGFFVVNFLCLGDAQ